MEHPLKGYFPNLTGRYLLLQLRTHNKQWQIILAKNEYSLLHAAQRIFEREVSDRCCVGDLFEIDIVSPPDYFCDLAAKKDREGCADDFFRQVTFTFYHSKVKNLPKQFTICNDFVYKYGDNPNDSEIEFHQESCQNCSYKMKLSNLTKDEFYDSFYEKWEAVNHVKKYIKNGFCPRYSVAEKSNDLTGIYGISTSGMNSGAETQLLTETDFIWPSLFYFKKVREINNEQYKKSLNDIEKDYKKRKAEEIIANHKEYIREENERIQKYLGIFE